MGPQGQLLPTGQRVAEPTPPQGAPALLPPQPGLGGLSQQLMMRKMGGPLPSRPMPQSMMPLPQPPQSQMLDPLTQAMMERQQ